MLGPPRRRPAGRWLRWPSSCWAFAVLAAVCWRPLCVLCALAASAAVAGPLCALVLAARWRPSSSGLPVMASLLQLPLAGLLFADLPLAGGLSASLCRPRPADPVPAGLLVSRPRARLPALPALPLRSGWRAFCAPAAGAVAGCLRGSLRPPFPAPFLALVGWPPAFPTLSARCWGPCCVVAGSAPCPPLRAWSCALLASAREGLALALLCCARCCHGEFLSLGQFPMSPPEMGSTGREWCPNKTKHSFLWPPCVFPPR